MSIRLKIIFVVLPLVIVTLLLAGTSSFFSATRGITRIANEFLGFKSAELQKNAESQWSILLENNWTEKEEYVLLTKTGIKEFAESIIKSPTELIIAINEHGNIALKTGDFNILIDENEKKTLLALFTARKRELSTLKVGGIERVAVGFYFEPFKWYILVTEEKQTLYSEVDKIAQQTIIFLVCASIAAIIMLLIFSHILTKPMTRMVSTMRDIISYNDLTERVKVEYHDEIGKLAHTFNIMIGELEKLYKQIKGFAFKAVLAQKKEQKIRSFFQKYVPNDVINSFFKNPESMLVGENRVLSILFSDIRGFTTISEKMMPGDVVNSLNRYFTFMVDIILNRNGIVDKYIGDAIMAFFGAPIKHKDDAFQSVMAGIEMSHALTEFNRIQIKNGKPEFHIGIGINYGIVTVGNIGTEKKMDYTVIGDMVNLASRLEGLTKKYKQELIISESIEMKVRNLLPCRLLDTIVVKGKTKGVKIFTVKKSLTEKEKEAWARHNSGMEYYYKKDFPNAENNFKKVIQILPKDYTSNMLLERCSNYKNNPPTENWDGSIIMDSK